MHYGRSLFCFFTYSPGWNCVEDWINDGQCDDINNSENCTYDGGDCCGNNAVNKYCSDCSCLGTINHILPYSLVINIFNYSDTANQRETHISDFAHCSKSLELIR